MAGSRSAATPKAVKSLRDHLSKGVTGCLTAITPGGAQVRVYLMQGEILASHGPDDWSAVIRQLANNGALSTSQAEACIQGIRAGERPEELLFSLVPEDLFLDTLTERFRQNLLDFASTEGVPVYDEMDAIFVDNIQVGHDTKRLVSDTLALRARIAPLVASLHQLRVAAGRGLPPTQQHARLLDLADPPSALAQLVEYSPFEPGKTLDLLTDLIAIKVIVAEPITPELDSEDLAEDPATEERATEDERGGRKVFEAATEPVPEPAAPPARKKLAPPPQDGEALDHQAGLPRPMVEAALRQAREAEARRAGANSRPEADGISTEPVVDEADDDESTFLHLFEDRERNRGSDAGQFSLKRDLLDLVDLSDRGLRKALADAETDDDLIVELGDDSSLTAEERGRTVAINFEAPKLGESDVRYKLRVANGVLGAVSEAIDQHAGKGAGRASVQLLLESTSSRYAILFHGLEVDREGQINVEGVVKNLKRRPPAEHRQLVNQGVLDLIERALSASVEELPEKAIEPLLIRIAGYQQQLGR